MRTGLRVQNRVLAAILALMMIIVMIPINVITVGAATEDHPDVFTITVKNAKDELIDKATVEYSVKVNDSVQLSDKTETEAGIAVVKNLETLDLSNPETAVSIDVIAYKTGFEKTTVENATVTDIKGNLDVKLTEKETVKISVSVTDSVNKKPISDADVEINGYHTVKEKTKNGKFEVPLYKNEKYSFAVTKNGYKEYSSETPVSFENDNEYKVSLVEKAVDDTFKFDEANPGDIEFGNESFVNEASCSKSSGTITYSVISGDSVAVDSSTGTITTLKAGLSTVQASLAEDDDYKKSEITYQINVTNAPDTGFGFSDPNPANIKFVKDGTYSNVASGGYGEGEVTYAITEGNAASVDKNTGDLSLKKAGTVTVTATRAADDKYAEISTSYSLTIEKADQAALNFQVLSPENQFVTNKTYTNRASGGSGKGSITYSITEGSEYAELTNERSATVNFKKVGGPVVVQAKRAGDDSYEPAYATYQFFIIKSPQDKMDFQTTIKTVVYSPNLTYSNPLIGGSGTGSVTYEIVSGDAAEIDENTGVLSIKKASDEEGVVVKATKAGDDNYEEQSAQFTLIIKKAEQTGFAFADGDKVNKTWSPNENTYNNDLSGGQSTGDITYSAVSVSEMPFGGPCASLDTETGKVTMYGKGVITIKATKEGDDCYLPIEAQYSLTINRASQSGFAFSSDISSNITYNDNNNQFSLSTVGGNGAGAVSYSIESGDAVSINEAQVSVLKAGNVSIKATKAETNTYEAATDQIDIVINKAEQYIAFENTTTKSIVYGNSFTNKAHEVVNSSVPDKKGYAPLTEITYSVAEGENIVSVDKNGKLSFKNNATGLVRIKAEKKGDDCYSDTSAEYTLNVQFVEIPDNAYSLSGEKINDSGWYSGDVTITPKEGYQISYSNDLTDDNTWSDKLVVSDEGYNGKTVYLKNENGISGAVIIPGEEIRIDKTTPQDLSISYSKSVIGAFLENASFGFYQSPVTVTIKATDKVSHIDYFEYSYGEETGIIESENITYTNDKEDAEARFTIPAQFRGKVSIKAVDITGNDKEKHDEKVIVVDDIAPGVTISFDNNNAANEVYYSDNRTATITIDESNFFSEAFNKIENIDEDPSVEVDEHLVITVTKVDNNNNSETRIFKNEDLTTSFTKNDDGKWEATLLFDEDADYTLKIEYKDFSGNSADTYETSFTIDKTNPSINVSYENNNAQNDSYYKELRTATFTVAEHNFRASDIVVETFSATNVKGEEVIDSTDFQKLLREGNWAQDGDTYTINIPFEKDANYKYKITYSDLAENEQVEPIVEGFTVDRAKPSELCVSYSKSVLDTFLEATTFGFYQSPVEVTISAEDETSGVDYFTYSYGVQVGASSINVGKGDTDIIENIDYTDDGKVATAKFNIPAQFRGSVSFTATDKAGNTSEVFNDNKVVVVDDVAPGVTVSYSPSSEEASNGYYYNSDRTATITINEANFFNEAFEKVENIAEDPSVMIDEHLVISVTRTDDNNVEKTQVIKSADLTTVFEETSEDVWTATLLFDQDGSYTWTIEYKDFSGNSAGTFTDSFVIDKTSPVISVSYDNNDALNGNCYKANRNATVTVEERNFTADNIVINSITAVDVQEKAVDYGKDYQKLLREGEWTHKGNTHSIEIPFDVDARYQYNITYTDLANNSDTGAIKDEYVIDKEAPDNLTVSYSTSVLDTILENATFGFYKAPATVTIEADDSISGVDYFTYSYKVADGESDINQGKDNIKISPKKYTEANKHASAEFSIDAQFRGEVTFTATDRSGNTSEVFGDGKNIVVDNVAPGVTVTYDNNSATYETYYNKSRTAIIKIKEANFFDESLEKVEDISKNPSALINEHLKIMVNAEDNDGNTVTKQIKSKDLKTQFKKSTTEKDTWEATLLFDKDADYSWSVEYKDFSGNVAGTFTDAFTVDNIDPVIDVTHHNNNAKNSKYFKADRPVTITISEHNFKAEDVVVSVKTTQATGKVADYQSYLTNPDNWTKKGNTYTANIVFDTEAFYTFDISYADMAGRKNQPVKYGESVAPKDFVVDKTAPTDADILIRDESVLAVNGVAFEKFYQSTAEVKYTVNCDISGLDNITYQKVDSLAAYSENASWTPFNNSVKVGPSEKFIIYFKAEDKAGNVTIVNSTGIVVDDKAPEGEKYAPNIDIEPATANENGLHNSNVNVALNVVEPKYIGSTKSDSGYYSGINKISYRIYTKDTNASEQGVLMDVANGRTSGAVIDKDKLISKWSGQITVNANTFNSNNVIVEITAIDNAGNQRVTTNEMINKPIKIDVTAPSIAVSYQDGSGNGDAEFADSTNGAYFKNDRTATVVITERNFDASKVKITLKKDGQDYSPSISSWSTNNGGGNGDGTTHTATIVYSADGIYSFDISFTDQAGNANTEVAYSGLSPKLFTVDKTNPKFSISYDNMNALNGNYYKEQRVATLTIEERNFEESRIKVTMTATDNGAAVSVPSVAGWSTGSNEHTATITYSADALYTFDIEYNDKAGNPLAEDFSEDRFYVDKTKPKVSITKIVDESANNDEGNIGYVITATDTNFDVFEPKLRSVVRNDDKFVVNENLNAGSVSGITNGQTYTVTNLPDDGVYKISCTVTDKAGNDYEDVTLSRDKNDSETYVAKRSGKETLLTFSVNREGSSFDLDDNTINLINKHYIQEVDNPVVISEINVDTLNQRKVSINGKELEESEYTFNQSGGDSDNWFKYQYTIKQGLFTDEGEYNVVVSSKDKAKNDAFSDIKNAGVKFIVDHTAPIVTVTGLSNDGRYQTESQTVTAVPTDDGGALKSIVVTLIGKDGKDDKELLNLSDDKFAKALEEGDGKVTFEVPEGLYQDVRIVCDDQAFHDKHENVIYDETFTNVSVTPNAFLIFWANKPLRYAVIGGVVLLAAGLVTLIILKQRKKKKATTK